MSGFMTTNAQGLTWIFHQHFWKLIYTSVVMFLTPFLKRILCVQFVPKYPGEKGNKENKAGMPKLARARGCLWRECCGKPTAKPYELRMRRSEPKSTSLGLPGGFSCPGRSMTWPVRIPSPARQSTWRCNRALLHASHRTSRPRPPQQPFYAICKKIWQIA